MLVFHHVGKVYRMRAFHFFLREVEDSLGADLRDIIPMRDICAQHAWTRRDHKELAALDCLICETYGISVEDYDEWQ